MYLVLITKCLMMSTLSTVVRSLLNSVQFQVFIVCSVERFIVAYK